MWNLFRNFHNLLSLFFCNRWAKQWRKLYNWHQQSWVIPCAVTVCKNVDICDFSHRSIMISQFLDTYLRPIMACLFCLWFCHDTSAKRYESIFSWNILKWLINRSSLFFLSNLCMFKNYLQSCRPSLEEIFSISFACYPKWLWRSTLIFKTYHHLDYLPNRREGKPPTIVGFPPVLIPWRQTCECSWPTRK